VLGGGPALRPLSQRRRLQPGVRPARPAPAHGKPPRHTASRPGTRQAARL